MWFALIAEVLDGLTWLVIGVRLNLGVVAVMALEKFKPLKAGVNSPALFFGGSMDREMRPPKCCIVWIKRRVFINIYLDGSLPEEFKQIACPYCCRIWKRIDKITWRALFSTEVLNIEERTCK